jgi:hypothetical protein
MCGSIIDGGNSNVLSVHYECAKWWYFRTATEFSGRVKNREYEQREFSDQLFHHQLVEAIGNWVKQTNAPHVADALQLPLAHMHGVLTLTKGISQRALDVLGYRKLPLYIKEGSVSWPLDLVQKSGNPRRIA